jgi:hypothetical protein
LYPGLPGGAQTPKDIPMEPLSTSVSIIAILEAVQSCLKILKKYVGPSSMSSDEAETLMKSLYDFYGATSKFQAHLHLQEDDESLSASLEYLGPVVKQSLEAVIMIKGHFRDRGAIAKAFRGAKFDRKLKASLSSLDSATKLFNMAVLSDQQ